MGRQRLISEFRGTGQTGLIKPIVIVSLCVGIFTTGVYLSLAGPDTIEPTEESARKVSEVQVETFEVDTSGIIGGQPIAISGQLRVNNSLVLTPSSQPAKTNDGQVYFDQAAKEIRYFDGTSYQGVASTSDVEAALRQQPAAQNITNITQQTFNAATTGTVTETGNNKFTGTNTFADISAEDVMISGTSALQGSLTVTGTTLLGPASASSLLLSSALNVASGGTGRTTFTTNEIVIGQGSGALSSIANGAAGLCLMSTAGAPSFQACPGGGSTGVSSVAGLTGDLLLSNSTASGSTITIDTATATSRGLASFNAANLTVTAGSVNTIQDIGVTSTPTFAGIVASSISSAGGLTVGSPTQTLSLQGGASSTFSAAAGANTTTLQFQVPTANVNYRFATGAAGTYDVCTTVGNCVGVGGSVSTSGGTSGRIAKFDSGSNIVNSLLSESGVTVTADGNFNVTSGSQYQMNGVQISSSILSNDSSLAKLNASQTFSGAANTFRNSADSAAALLLQNAAGQNVAALDTTNGAFNLGSGSALDGKLVVRNATNNFTVTVTAANSTANRTISLGNDSGTICLQGSSSCGFAGSSGSGSYVQNQNSAQQAATNFWISGAGRADTALQAPVFDAAVAGALTLGGTNATSIAMTQNTTLGAGKYLLITGGTTGTRPVAPTEGMMYYDTTTKQLLTYANGKWQSDRSTATKIVGDASTSQNTDAADYVVPAGGTSAQTTINAAINALPASGGVVYLMEGTYNVDASIVLKSNVTLVGAGTSSTIRVKNAFDGFLNMFTNADTTNGNFRITLKDIRLDGNSSNQTNGNQKIAAFTKVGTGTGVTAVPGIKVNGLMAEGFGRGGSAITFTTSNNNVISGSIFVGLRDSCNCNDITTFTGDNNLITGNQFIDGRTSAATVKTTGNSNTISNNLFEGNSGSDIIVSGQNASVTGNQITNNQSRKAITLNSVSYSNISNNNISFSSATNNAAISGTSSFNNVISGNTMKDIFNFGISLATNSNDNIITDNLIYGQGTGIYISGSSGGKINNNIIPTMVNNGVGISLSGTTRMTISDNSVTTATLTGILLTSASHENIINGNRLHDNGGSGMNDSIQVASSNSNSIIGNHITDTAGTGYAINITSSASSANYLADNRFSGTGATAIQDFGTGTTYSNQSRTANGGQLTVRTANDANAFQVQNAAGTSLLNADSTNMRISVGTVGGFSDAPTKLANPAILPVGTSQGTAFSPDGQYMSVTHSTSPFITIYKRSGDTFTKLADPATLPTGYSVATAFSPDGQYMSVGHQTSPFITIYKRSGDTFTKLANPTSLPTSTGTGTSFSPDGQYMSVTHSASPFITIYKRSGDTFTKLANPTSLPAGYSQGTAFTPDGQYMTVAHDISPFITIYKRSGDTFTKLANPTSLPSGTARATAFSPDGQYMSVTHSTSPFITIYKRSGDTFTKLADPVNLPTSTAFGIAFSPDGQYMSVGHDISPFITIYKRSGDTFTKLANPATLPTGTGYTTAFSSDGQYMSVAHGSSPFITIYKGAGGAVARMELASGTTTDEGLAFGKELKVYRSAPGILSLAAGGSLSLEGGNLSVQGGAYFAGNVGIGAAASGNLLSIGALSMPDTSAQLAVGTGLAGNKGLIIQGVSSQTGDLLQMQSSSGAVLSRTDAAGMWYLGPNALDLHSYKSGLNYGLEFGDGTGYSFLLRAGSSTILSVADTSNSAFTFNRPAVINGAGIGLQVSTGTTATGAVIVAKNGTGATGDLLQAQNSIGSILAKIDASGNLTVKDATVTGTLTVAGHIISGGSNPTIVAGAAACATPTVSVSGTDTAGVITMTTGTGCAVTGNAATITFATAFGAAPKVTLTPASGAAAGLNAYLDDASLGTASFTLGISAVPLDATTYKWHYHALQ